MPCVLVCARAANLHSVPKQFIGSIILVVQTNNLEVARIRFFSKFFNKVTLASELLFALPESSKPVGCACLALDDEPLKDHQDGARVFPIRMCDQRAVLLQSVRASCSLTDSN